MKIVALLCVTFSECTTTVNFIVMTARDKVFAILARRCDLAEENRGKIARSTRTLNIICHILSNTQTEKLILDNFRLAVCCSRFFSIIEEKNSIVMLCSDIDGNHFLLFTDGIKCALYFDKTHPNVDTFLICASAGRKRGTSSSPGPYNYTFVRQKNYPRAPEKFGSF